MHIYQAGYFYLGIFIAGSGAVLFCSSVVAMLKKRQQKTYENKNWIVMSLYYTVFGALQISRAFDLPHYESSRTSVIGFILLFALAIVLVSLYLLKRSQKNVAAIKPD